jgi:hypothetical protein
MTKVVITPSVFGFGLSIEAVERLQELGVEFKMPAFYDEKYPDKNSRDAKLEFALWASDQIERTDSKLIQVVAELGDKAGGIINDRYIRLVIMDIPDDIKWYIETGDEFQNEWIAEEHRIWIPEGEEWDIKE